MIIKLKKIKSILKKINRLLLLFGLNPVKLTKSILGLPFYIKDFANIYSQRKISNNKKKWKLGGIYPILDERFAGSGVSLGHYFHQDLLIAQKIYINNPKKHVDIGSRVDGFIAHVASFRPITVIDIREPPNQINNISVIQADIIHELPSTLYEYCDSLSSLHAVEHFGLGRYSDPINYEGYIFGLNNMYNMLRGGGKFYFSVPIGPQRIEFNAHRVFALNYLMEIFEDKYVVDSFSFVDDNGDMHSEIELSKERVLNNCNCSFGCGIFEMTKI